MSEQNCEKVMTIEEIKEMVAGPRYDFLRKNEHLAGKIMFLTLGGSYAYGTNVAGSDVDVRGCAANSMSDLVGLTNFEQVINNETDTTVYAFNKLVGLLLNCNPNVIEMLGCKPEHYFHITKLGQELIDNRRLFLSRKAINAFGGYANQQLRRLENAITHDRLPQPKQEEYMRKAVEKAVEDFGSKSKILPVDAIRLYTDKSDREELEREVFADIDLKRFPVRDLRGLINEMTNIIGNYDKLNGRNKKKDDAHLAKHAMHLIRLYLMCLDILEKEEIVTYREADHDMLMEIRNGKYMNEDGTYQQEFFDMVNDLEKRLQYAKENTALPAHPNMKRVGELVEYVNMEVLMHGGV